MNNLEDIKNRLAAATPGPWRTWKDNDGRRGSAVETTWAHDADGADTELITDWCSPDDAEFIAHAPEDIARLVKALGAVERQCAYWDTLADGDRHYAARIRDAITEALDS